MNPLAAFLKLVRWPNLFFIIFTQVLFYYCVLPFVYRTLNNSGEIFLSSFNFFLIVAASVFIAAAGYIINDYFDLHIDLVNKPSRLIIEKYIKRRWAIVMHLCFSVIGFLLSCYVGYRLHNIYIPFYNLICIALLWFYSTTFKGKLLVGNVVISLLTSWVILVITVAVYKSGYVNNLQFIPRLLKLSFLYAGFAFIISLVREVVKDIEDIRGDEKYNCQTMPIVWGVPVAKIFAAVWLIVLLACVSILQFYVLQLGWYASVIYAVILIIIPLIWICRNLYSASMSADYKVLSNAIKAVMLTGILSMIFFRFYL